LLFASHFLQMLLYPSLFLLSIPNLWTNFISPHFEHCKIIIPYIYIIYRAKCKISPCFVNIKIIYIPSLNHCRLEIPNFRLFWPKYEHLFIFSAFLIFFTRWIISLHYIIYRLKCKIGLEFTRF
jgi:hypothetical protein